MNHFNGTKISLSSHCLNNLFNSFEPIVTNISRVRRDSDQDSLEGCGLECACSSTYQSKLGDLLLNYDHCPCSCVVNRGSNYNYSKDNLLNNWYLPVYECHSNCYCDPSSCLNRVTQTQPNIRLELYECEQKCICVRTLEVIERGQFVGQYLGEIIDQEEATRRFKEHKSSTHNYLLIFREHFSESNIVETIVDARHSGNISRFFNHSCDPNLSVIPVRTQLNRPTLCFFANKRIEIGQELTYDYGSSSSSASDKLCHCSSQNCRKYLPSDLIG